MYYLASPYTHADPEVRQKRYEKACEAAASLIRKGDVLFCPIAMTHGMVKYGLPYDIEFWKMFDISILRKCWKLVILKLPGWELSAGIAAETEFARKMNIPVEYMEPK